MVTYREALEGAVRSSACAILGTADGLDRVLNVPDRPFPLLGAADDFTDGVRDFYRESVCPDPASDPYPPGGPAPIIPAPPGGDCPAEYRVFVTVDRLFNGAPAGTITDQAMQGLIDGPGVSVAIRSNGQNVDATNPLGDMISLFGGTNSSTTFTNLRDVRFERTDGQPDECPGQTLPPPRVEEPITYDPPSGSPITISPVITFPPVVIDRSNNLIIPVVIAYANVRITANLNLNVGSINFNFGRGSGGGKDCCPPPQIPGTPPTDPDNTPPPAEDSVIQGVIITVTQLNAEAPVTRVLNPNGPNAYFPDLGLVWFRVRTDQVLPWLPPIKIQGTFTLIRCPWPEGAVDVSAIARPGVNFTITVVYANVSQLGS